MLKDLFTRMFPDTVDGNAVGVSTLPNGTRRIEAAMQTMVSMHNELAQGVAEVREEAVRLQARRDEIEAEIGRLAVVEDDAEEAIDKITALIPKSLVAPRD